MLFGIGIQRVDEDFATFLTGLLVNFDYNRFFSAWMLKQQDMKEVEANINPFGIFQNLESISHFCSKFKSLFLSILSILKP